MFLLLDSLSSVDKLYSFKFIESVHAFFVGQFHGTLQSDFCRWAVSVRFSQNNIVLYRMINWCGDRDVETFQEMLFLTPEMCIFGHWNIHECMCYLWPHLSRYCFHLRRTYIQTDAFNFLSYNFAFSRVKERKISLLFHLHYLLKIIFFCCIRNNCKGNTFP